MNDLDDQDPVGSSVGNELYLLLMSTSSFHHPILTMGILAHTAFAAILGLAYAKPFDVDDLLSAPRAQAPILNPAGDLVLSVVDRWNSTNDQ